MSDRWDEKANEVLHPWELIIKNTRQFGSKTTHSRTSLNETIAAAMRDAYNEGHHDGYGDALMDE